jgi:hypothetical protein
MKKLKIVLTTLIVALALFSFSQGPSPYPTFKFTNPKIISGTPDTLQFEVSMKCDVGTTYHTDIFVAFNYNTDAFGPNIVANEKIFLQKVGLTAGQVAPGVPYYNILGPSDAILGRIAFGTEPNLGYTPAFLNLVPTTFTPYMRVKMLISNNTVPAGIFFEESYMNTGQYYILTATPIPTEYGVSDYDAIDFANLPLSPAHLMFSEIGDPSNTTTNFVEIYNASAFTVDFDNHYAWYLNAGTSSVQLTGTLAAGAKYTIAYNNTDFVPTLVSTIVGTLGTTQYLLSIYGDYATGTAIDVYNGSGTGIAFTGKHAVRHYNTAGPNTTFTAAEWVVSPAEDIDMTPGSHHSVLNWSGGTSADWHARANWGTSLIPDAGHNVSITSVGTAPIISNGDNAYCHDLAVVSGSLTIESLPGSGGSLITYGTVTGSTTVQRYLLADRYWYVSEPVASATANVFLHMWLFTYTGGAWTPFIVAPTTPLNLMQGYAVWTSSINSWDENPPLGTVTTSYSGVLNTGNQSTALITGWNFVGNPYPSAVDWTVTGWTKTNLVTNAYSEWNGTVYGTYTVGSGGTNGATKDIPAAQGFFVQASAAGTLGVANAVRLHSTQAFYKVDENMANRLSMTVSNGEVNDETVIYFNENGTTGLDYDYDAHKMMAEAAPQAYTMLADEQMAINTYNNTTQTPSVILGVNAPAAGEYTITASNLESFDASTPIYLEDLLTGQKINLREMSSYAFTAGEGTSERFVVHFTEYQGIGDNPLSEVNSIYAVNLTVYVDFSAVKGEIVIYNILGQEISRSAAKNGLNMISVPQGNAVYIVKVISDNTTVTKKVFVK